MQGQVIQPRAQLFDHPCRSYESEKVTQLTRILLLTLYMQAPQELRQPERAPQDVQGEARHAGPAQRGDPGHQVQHQASY